jgi:hypothetical protein
MKKIPKLLFVDIYYKKLAHPFFGAWSLLVVHKWFTSSQGPEGFFKHFP